MKALAVAGGMLALLVLLGCCCAVGVPAGLFGLLGSVVFEQVLSFAVRGDGRYVIVEHGDPMGEPSGLRAVAIDRETGERHEIRGFHVLAAESEAEIAWVSAVQRDAAYGELTWAPGEALFPGGNWDERADAVPHRLLVWRFAEDDETSVPEEPSWRPIERGDGLAVVLRVDEDRGALPSAMSVVRSSVSSPTRVVLPADFRTFRPAGWSDSERYFAIVELVSGEWGTRAPRVVVVDVEKGAVCASVTIGGSGAEPDPYGGGEAMWDGDRDLLWVLTVEGEAMEPALTTLDPETGREERRDPPSGWYSMPPTFLRTHDGAPLVTDGESLWTMRGGRVHRLADVPPRWGDLQPLVATGSGEVLLMDSSPFSESIFVAAVDGSADPEVVWTAEETRKWRWPGQ